MSLGVLIIFWSNDGTCRENGSGSSRSYSPSHPRGERGLVLPVLQENRGNLLKLSQGEMRRREVGSNSGRTNVV